MKVQALIDQVLDEAMRLGQKPHGAYRSYWDVYNPIITFFRGRGLEDYSPEVLKEYIAWVTDKYQNGQIKRERHSMLTTAARRVAHFERTGAYLWNVPKGEPGMNWTLTTRDLWMSSSPAMIFIRTLPGIWSGWRGGISTGSGDRGSQTSGRQNRRPSRNISTAAWKK